MPSETTALLHNFVPAQAVRYGKTSVRRRHSSLDPWALVSIWPHPPRLDILSSGRPPAAVKRQRASTNGLRDSIAARPLSPQPHWRATHTGMPLKRDPPQLLVRSSAPTPFHSNPISPFPPFSTSDELHAVYLAVCVGAERLFLVGSVPGFFSAHDPIEVPDARLLRSLGYREVGHPLGVPGFPGPCGR